MIFDGNDSLVTQPDRGRNLWCVLAASCGNPAESATPQLTRCILVVLATVPPGLGHAAIVIGSGRVESNRPSSVRCEHGSGRREPSGPHSRS